MTWRSYSRKLQAKADLPSADTATGSSAGAGGSSLCPGCGHRGISVNWAQGVRYDYCPECGLTASPVVLVKIQQRGERLCALVRAAQEYIELVESREEPRSKDKRVDAAWDAFALACDQCIDAGDGE